MKYNKIHFIGIGGIGVSALAQYYHNKGHKVSGSDLSFSEITDYLKNMGIKISKSQPKASTQLPDLVIYSPAVKQENPELKFYKEKGIECLSYPEALGQLTKEYYTIAISGAHGKSTTTAMTALILIKAGFDPTVIVGTKLREFGNPALSEAEGSNFRAGNSEYLVIEACEYESSFLNYHPQIIAVTNIDKEHLDYFKTFANVKRIFKDFILKLPAGGYLVFNGEDKELSVIARKLNGVKLTKQSPRLRLLRFARNDEAGPKIKKLLKVPGEHNVSNALAALQVARILRIPDRISFKALSEFKGTWRRFEEKQGNANGKKIIVISDYGHHPNEISATLKAAREKYPKERITCVFQPHQRQRTYYLFNDFVRILRQAQDDYFINKIIVTDIYDVAGREERGISKKINSQKLVEKINRKNIIYLPLTDIENFIKNPPDGGIKSGDILIIMGAGDIYKLADKFAVIASPQAKQSYYCR